MLPLLSTLALVFGGDALDAERSPWLDLDSALQSLQAESASDPLSFGVLLRAFYTVSPKEGAGSTNDVSGQVFEDVDVYFGSHEREIAWRVSADLADGTLVLEDAYARWRHAEWFALTVGQFKPRVVRSASLPAGELLLRERTFLGAAFDVFDDGLELGGHYDQFDYWFAVTDSGNGEQSDHFWSVRGEWALYDEAGPDVEGARGSPDYLRFIASSFLFRDEAASSADGGGWGADLALTFGPYGFHWEWARLEEQFARTVDVFNGAPLTMGDGQPFSATFSRLVGPGEAVVRYQRADDADDTSAWSVGANWTPGGGPARFVADLARVEADSQDFSLFSIGVNVGTSGQGRPFSGADAW